MPSQTALATQDSAALNGRHRGFVPTPAQLRLLDAWLDTGSDDTIKALAERAKVNRRTVYDWLELPEFCAWFTEECTRRFNFHSKRMWQRCVELATKGSPDHIRLVAQRLGELQREGAGLNDVRQGITNVFVNVPRPGELAASGDVVMDIGPAILPVATPVDEQ